MQRHVMPAATAIIALTVGGAAALAASDKIDLDTWDQSNLYQGWSAEDFIGKDVRDTSGNDLGDVENFYVDDDGDVTKVIVEAGGFLDIGDTHLSVPWEEVSFTKEDEAITVPIEADNVDAFSLFADDPEPKVDAFRVTELLGDYVFLDGDEGYGMVQDIILDDAGKVQAVIVTPDVRVGRPGYYAYPYYGPRAGYDPRGEVYNLPYSMREIEALGPFDYGALQG